MSREQSVLGTCPRCDGAVPRYRLLVTYETADGDTGTWADCPSCGDVVAPE